MKSYDEERLKSASVKDRNRNPDDHHVPSNMLYMINIETGECEVVKSDVFKNARGSLVPIEEDSMSLMAIGGYASDIWVWSIDSFKKGLETAMLRVSNLGPFPNLGPGHISASIEPIRKLSTPK